MTLNDAKKQFSKSLEPVPKLIDPSKSLNTMLLPNFIGDIYGKTCNQRLSMGVN